MALLKKSTSHQKEIQEDKIEKDSILLSWDAPEFVNYEKNTAWYIVAGLILIAFIGYFLYSKEWISALTFVVLGVVAYKFFKIEPKSIKYSISKSGITVEDKFYPYNELHSFWIAFLPNQKNPVKTLYIQSTKKYLPLILIQLKDLDPVMVKSILKRYLPEQEKRGENFMDKLVRIFRL